MLRRRIAALLLTLPLVASACSGGVSAEDQAKLEELKAELAAIKAEEAEVKAELAQVTGEGVTTTTTRGRSEDDRSVNRDEAFVGQTIHYREFELVLGRARVLPVESGSARGKLDIEVTCKNLGAAAAYCPDAVEIESRREFYRGHISGENATIREGRESDRVWSFPIDENFSLLGAVLRLGQEPQHVAEVTLCPGEGDSAPVLLTPVDLPIAATMQAGLATFTITGMKLRADAPGHQQRPLKELTLEIFGDLAAEPPASRGYLDQSDFELALPDGSVVDAEAWSVSVHPSNPVREKGTVLRFAIKNPPAGAYELRLDGYAAEHSDAVPATFDFSIG